MHTKLHATLIILGVIAFSCNQPPSESEVIVEDTISIQKESQVEIFYAHSKKENYVVGIDTNLIEKYGGEEMKAIAWGGPMKISLENGTYYVEDIEQVVNFDIDEDCGDKYYRFKLPIDTAIKYLEKRKYSDSYYFNWSAIFDTTAKRFIIEEIWHRGENNKVLAEIKHFNIYYAMEGLDSLQILNFYPKNVFDEEITIESWVINNSSNAIDQANVDLSVSEYKDNKSEEVVSQAKYKNLNLLVAPIPPHTFQIVKKSFKNTSYQPAAETKLVYFNTEQVLKDYGSNGKLVPLNKPVK